MRDIANETELQAAKSESRTKALALRRAMSPEDRAAASAAIHKRLFELPAFVDAEGVHCYIALDEEVSTEAIFEACRQRGKRTYVPYQIPNEARLGWCAWSPGEPLIRGPFGISEPALNARVSPEPGLVDLVIVPGAAFDREGRRLGHGKGYYDRFLAELASFTRYQGLNRRGKNRVVFVGLAFHCQLVAEVPCGPRDIKLHGLLTEFDKILTHG